MGRGKSDETIGCSAMLESHHTVGMESRQCLVMDSHHSSSLESQQVLGMGMHHSLGMDPGMSQIENLQTSYQQTQNVLRHYLITQKVDLPKLPTPVTGTFSSHLQAPMAVSWRPAKQSMKSFVSPSPGSSSSESNGSFCSPSAVTGARVKTVPRTSPRQEISVIQPPPARSRTSGPANFPGPRKGGRFRPGWLDTYVWLQYDERMNIMFCKYCRKWSNSVPDIRTSFADGNSNFRLEIVNHHDKCKAHRLCMEKEVETINKTESTS